MKVLEKKRKRKEKKKRCVFNRLHDLMTYTPRPLRSLEL